MISVVIANYNGEHILKNCLSPNMAIFNDLGITDIIIVDDNSSDGSVEYITTHFPEINIIQNSEQLFFSRNCNRGADVAKEDILLFLNNDMVFSKLDLSMIKTYLDQDDVFAVSPTIMRKNDEGVEYNEAISMGFFKAGWFSSENFPDIETTVEKPEGMPLMWVCGGALFVKKENYDMVGGFDPIYAPFYVEDLDLCYKGWKRGLRSVYTQSALCHHQHQSTIGTYFTKSYVEQVHLRNQFIFMWLNITSKWMLFQHVFCLLIMCLTFQVRHARAIIKAVMKLPEIRKKRRQRGPEHQSDARILRHWKPFVRQLLKARRKK
jgi:GT2 family glycosyltransferase